MLRTVMSLALGLAAGIGASAAYAQGSGGPGESSQQCMVTRLRMRIATSNDDLRGGQDNLNIIVYFTGDGYQFAPNVNHSQNWPNNSVNMVEIPLSRPVPPGEIRALRLVHIADGGFNIGSYPELATPAAPIAIAQAFQSPDNWNMADIEVAVLGNGVGGRIAGYGYHRFTGSNPDLIIGTHVPPNICSSGRPSGNSGGTASGSSGGGSGMLISPRTQKGMLPEQPQSSKVLEDDRAANAVTPGVGSNSGPGGAPAKPLTNAVILNMLGANLSEETILTTIRIRPATFDVSNQARAAFDRECAAIKHTGVTTAVWAAEVKHIWDAMTNVVICQQTNGRGGEDACTPSGQQTEPKPATNGGQSAQPDAAAHKRGDYSTLVPAIQRPALNDGNVATAGGMNNGNRNADELSPQPYPPKGAVNTPGGSLQAGKHFVIPQNLKITTGAEVKNPAALAMPLKIAMPQGQGGNIGSGHIMSASGGGTTASPTASRPMLAAPPAQANAAGQPPAAAGPNNQNKYDRLSPNTTALCLNKAVISTVTEKAPGNPPTQEAVFTPDLNTEYVITGCGFGNTPGQIYLTGGFPANGGKVAMVPFHPFGTPNAGGWGTHWTDRQIEASVDPNVTGELDQGNITLVIVPSGGSQLQAGWGFNFYARRGAPVMVPQIPESAFGHDAVFNAFGGFASPCGAWVMKDCTVEVLRAGNYDASLGYQITPDVYTINLKPGFAIYSVVAETATPQGSVANIYNPVIKGNQIIIDYPISRSQEYSFSLYGLKIYAVGPFGVNNPWAGE